MEITIGRKGGESRAGAALLHLHGWNRLIPRVRGQIISRTTGAIQEALTLAR